MKKFILTISFLLIATNSFATRQIFSRTPVAINTGATTFYTITGSGSASTTETNRHVLSGIATNLLYLRAHLSAPPENGVGTQSVTVTIRKNVADTSLACTMSETVQDCLIAVSVAVAAGDRINATTTVANTPAAANITFSFVSEGTTANETFLGSGTGGTAQPTSGSTYIDPYNCFVPNTTETNMRMLVPTDGTISNAYFRTTIAPNNGGGTQSWVYTIRIDTGGGFGSTGVTKTLSETTVNDSDLVNTYHVSAGDLLTIQITAVNTPASFSRGITGFRFVPDNPHEFIMAMVNTGDALNASTTEYAMVAGSDSFNATETIRQNYVINLEVKNMWVSLVNPPQNGASTQSYTFTFRNQEASGDSVVTISEDQLEDFTETFDQSDSDGLISTQIVPAGTPTTGSASISYTLKDRFTEIQGAIINGATLN